MPIKIKFLFGAIAAIAVFSVYAIFDSLTIPGGQPASVEMVATGTAFERDSDNDGLTDIDESFWETDLQSSDTDGDGFLDGEEVASSHDPRKPGPDDVIARDNTPQNITQKVGNLLLAGYSEGSLQDTNPNKSGAISQIAQEIDRQSQINISATIKDDLTLEIIEDSAENTKKYGEEISPTLKIIAEGVSKNFTSILTTFDLENSDFLDELDSEAYTMHVLKDRIQKINVPQSWTSQHTALLTILARIEANYTLLKTSKSDSLQAFTVLTDLTTLILTELPRVMHQYSKIYAR